MTARTGWLLAGAVLTVIAVTVGPATAALWLARQLETQRRTYELRGDAFAVEFDDPDIRIVPGHAGELVVERSLAWSAGRPTVTEEWDGQRLRISAECPRVPIGPRCDVEYTLRVPPGAALAARGGHGDLTIGDLDGRLSAQTTSGDIRSTNLRCAEVSLRTISGDVRARFTRPPDRVDATTTTGDIELGVPPNVAYRLHVDAAQRQLGIGHDATAPRTISARTERGSVRLG